MATDFERKTFELSFQYSTISFVAKWYQAVYICKENYLGVEKSFMY